MAGFKNGKIMLPIKEFLIVKGQATYELNTIDMPKVTVFYRKYNQEAFLETYSEMPKGDYRINEVGGNKQLEITNLDILDEYYSIQLARVVDLTSSPYNPSGQIDVITLNQHLNEVIADVTFLFTYLKDVGMVMDSSNGNKIMAELKPYTTWYMDKDGNMAAMPVDSLFEKFNDLVQELRQEVLKLLEQDLEVAERELLEEVKRQLDEYVETDLKQRLDDYTTQLEERLQTMIDQAVADKGLMPEGSDWLEIGLGNWLVVDLFNKNYIHYPPQLNSSDNAGVVKKDITDGGKSQVIRYYTTTGKMLFVVRVNEVWSEWQELGGQTDTMQFTQANHGFVFTAVTLDGATRKWVKANKYTSADGVAIKIDNDRFDVVTRGIVNIPTSARDDKGEPFVYDEYYFLSQEVDGGFSRTKNEIGTFQYLAHISEIDGKQVAYIDIGDSYDLDYEVVDTETADRVGIGTYKTTLRTADTIEDLKRLNLKEGDVVEVLGYYTKGDGANHKRKIESSDDGSGVQLSNGLWANVIIDLDYADITWFGAKKDENRESSPITTQAFKKALECGRNVFIPEGSFWIDEPLYINVEKQWLRGSSSRSVILTTNAFPKNEFMLTFYSNNGDYYTRNKREQKHGMFKLHGKTDSTGAIVNGFRTSGIKGTDKEGHVDCQIYENIVGEYLNIFIEYGSHVYRCTFHQVDGNNVKYFVKSADDQYDAGEVPLFLNCGIWGGLIYLTHSCKFISCAIHLNGTQQVNGINCGHYFASSDYEFTNCHFESILRNQENYDEVRENRFYVRDGYLNFTECDAVMSGQYMTIGNAFFLTETTSNNNTSSWVNINGGNWQYLFGRLKGDFVLIKGQGKISNIKQRNAYGGLLAPKRYDWTKESFRSNKECIYYGGFSDNITEKTVEVLDDESVKFKVVRSKSSMAICGIYKSINVSNNVNVRYVLEVELNTVGLKAMITSNGYSLIALDKDDNVIDWKFNSANENNYSQLTAQEIGDTFTVTQVLDLPMGTETLLYGVGLNTNLLDVDFVVKKCYVELI